MADELSSGLEPPHCEENFFTIALRLDRVYKVNSWSENPPARTRRMISNVEVEVGDVADELHVYSHFFCTFSRHQSDNHLYSGQRRALLRRDGGPPRAPASSTGMSSRRRRWGSFSEAAQRAAGASASAFTFFSLPRDRDPAAVTSMQCLLSVPAGDTCRRCCGGVY